MSLEIFDRTSASIGWYFLLFIQYREYTVAQCIYRTHDVLSHSWTLIRSDRAENKNKRSPLCNFRLALEV